MNLQWSEPYKHLSRHEYFKNLKNQRPVTCAMVWAFERSYLILHDIDHDNFIAIFCCAVIDGLKNDVQIDVGKYDDLDTAKTACEIDLALRLANPLEETDQQYSDIFRSCSVS